MKAKAYLEWNLAEAKKGNKNNVCKCISRKRKNRKNANLLLNGAGVLLTDKLEKAKALSVSPSALTTLPSARPGPCDQWKSLEQGVLTLSVGGSV